MDQHQALQRSARSVRALVILGTAATLLLAAVGFGVMSTTGHAVRDPENPAFVGSAPSAPDIGVFIPVVRDPENPTYSGNLVFSDHPHPSLYIVRDPENPAWTAR